LTPQSLPEMAAEEIRKMILTGELQPSERLREERLTEILGISRPPLREASLLLQQEGLVVRTPRRGAAVISLLKEDVYEILLLRTALERLAVEHGIPVREPKRLQRCRDALAAMQESAEAGNRAELVERGYVFHASIVALAGLRRVDEIYRSLHSQLLICMGMNLYAREHYYEDLAEHVRRHKVLLDVIEKGDPQAVLAEFAAHGERSFTKHPQRGS
jgi:DNA-binding GntR family transcriptional regulator